MNAWYQYFLASGQTESQIDPAGDEGVIISPPNPSGLETGTGGVPEVVSAGDEDDETVESVESGQGEGQISTPSTTINIFGSGTQYGTHAEQVSIDPNIAAGLSTSTSDPNAALTPSLGGGGGGGIMGGGDEGAGPAPMIKTWIPVIVLAAGVAVLILKPFKKKA